MNVAVSEMQSEPPQYVSPAGLTPLQVLQTELAQCVDLARLEKLMDLEERWRAQVAKREYVAAFSGFKKNAPDVIKDMLNKQYGSDYSSLANLVNTVNKALGEYGLNARWDIDQSDVIHVACILSHVGGHSERVRLQGLPDNTGSKNTLQQLKSTLTYLEGATFQAVTGVVARSASTDDDGKGAGKKSAEPSPDGYDNWHADMTALADEGLEALTLAWGKSKPEFRRYVIKFDEPWWRQLKITAAKKAAS